MNNLELALATAGVFLIAALVVTLLAYVGWRLIERWRCSLSRGVDWIIQTS